MDEKEPEDPKTPMLLEIEAVKQLAILLQPLDKEARQRVLMWARTYFDPDAWRMGR